MNDPHSSHPPLVRQTASNCFEDALKWLSAKAIELVSFPPEGDLYEFICQGVKELVGNAVVSVNSIDVEADLLRVRRIGGLQGTRLRRVEGLLEKKIIGATFHGIHEEAKRELNSGSLARVDGGLHGMFFGRVPRPACVALEKLLGVKSIHSIGLRRKNKLLGNVTILAQDGAHLNRHVIEAFVNQASAALDRQQAERKARQADENLRVIARNVTDLVWIAEFQGIEEFSAEALREKQLDAEALLGRCRLTFASPSSRQVLDYAPEQLKQARLRDLFTEQAWETVRQRFGEELNRALSDGEYSQSAAPVEVEQIDGEGKPRWCEITARFLRNEQSNIVGMLGVTRDIDQRRQENEALRQEHDRQGKLLEMQERDRNLIAYEIHDGLVQPIVAAQMAVESHLRQFEGGPPNEAALDGAQSAMQLLSGTISKARRLMRGLRPAVLEDFGVVPAVENLVVDHRTDAGPVIELTHDVGFERLPPPLETAVFRVVQESLVNALRHAQSDRIEIGLAQHDQQLRIEVRDWGVGFDPGNRKPTSFGLEGIRQRAQVFNGHAQIDSRPGQGTKITVVLPLVSHAGESGVAEE